MSSRLLPDPSNPHFEINVFADKSSLILDWLLRSGLEKESFALRSIVQEVGVSIGLVQKVLKQLVFYGFLKPEGEGTLKRFSIPQPEHLLKAWIQRYSILKKCRMWTYSSAITDKEQIVEVLASSLLSKDVAMALHLAAEAYGCKNTTLKTLEFYFLNPKIKGQLIDLLQLEPRERGYDVLLIEPYYKRLLSRDNEVKWGVAIAPPLLSFLDLYHFPLRGLEQAEFMAQRLPELKRIYRSK